MAAKYSRRPSHLSESLSPNTIPELSILPHPLPTDALPCGQLVSLHSQHTPSSLEERDYDDIGTRWYKDVIFLDTKTGAFLESFGGTHLVEKPLGAGQEAGTIEAEEQRVRLLKDPEASLKRIWAEDDAARKWIQEQGEVGFVVAIRAVSNASYKRARLVDTGVKTWEVVREVGGQDASGKRRDSGLDVKPTNSKLDVVGVVVRRVVMEGDDVGLGGELGAEYWN
ncbi:uncharacterized protein EKO05_0009915 [Ascochyta rabiei]|uniref:Uncharacterized protein n=1 Tax=Didymella rabiei TaxID=5454 RepID=A0A163MGC1_DIDRA|nr:uncharacterized protein EKO05_0009915 [Ascochyta rabiei]KZM28692.1 hypothetical protein ST47_g159 [Ascochyta rabiei]UPX19660.1 hypothetical protein EKO05_0009915 [Ascochyta rabiei]